MADPRNLLAERVSEAIKAAYGKQPSEIDPAVRPSQNPKFGDYQANVAMGLAKQVRAKPRDVATAILEKLRVEDICKEAQVAGPGFINLSLSADFVADAALALQEDPRLGVTKSAKPKRVVIDYSSPNVAKQMHVGHLRSTVIGDALGRTLEFLGHTVVRHNHLGDWGTQFGMLIEHLLDLPAHESVEEVPEDVMPAHAGIQEAASELRLLEPRCRGNGEERRFSTPSHQGEAETCEIADLDAFYKQAKQRFDSDEEFAKRARQRVVALQQGDEATLRHWKALVEVSKRHFNVIYERLGATLRDEHLQPESFYNPMLEGTAAALENLATLDAGALCVFVPGFAGPEGKPVPLIVRKSDGGFGYAATDLAALRYRSENVRAERIVYVVDSRQADHFAMIFWVAEQLGWLSEQVRAEHCRFGTILGPDHRPFKTREGETVRLGHLLDEALSRARAIVAEKNADMSAAEQEQIAQVVGLGAVKYGDLSCDRVKDYVFSWDRMLAMDGNTAPYLQYAYARIQSIFSKAGIKPRIERREALMLAEPLERAVLLGILRFGTTVEAVAERLEPHLLCTHLYELASSFNTFYNASPVLRAENEALRNARLVLCDLTARTLRLGLGLLGIEVLERM